MVDENQAQPLVDYVEAAQRCQPLIEQTFWRDDIASYGKDDLRTMIAEMQTWDQTDQRTREKGMRWLGWLQAAIVIGGGATYIEMQELIESSVVMPPPPPRPSSGK